MYGNLSDIASSFGGIKVVIQTKENHLLKGNVYENNHSKIPGILTWKAADKY